MEDFCCDSDYEIRELRKAKKASAINDELDNRLEEFKNQYAMLERQKYNENEVSTTPLLEGIGVFGLGATWAWESPGDPAKFRCNKRNMRHQIIKEIKDPNTIIYYCDWCKKNHITGPWGLTKGTPLWFAEGCFKAPFGDNHEVKYTGRQTDHYRHYKCKYCGEKFKMKR